MMQANMATPYTVQAIGAHLFYGERNTYDFTRE
jgi:hypothetical protein